MPAQSINGTLEDTASTEPPSPNRPKPDPKPIEWFRENSIPIAGVLFIALVVCLLLHYEATANDRSRTKDIAEIFGNYVQAIAIIAGGAWAIFTFSKGRQFQESLVLNVSGKIVVVEDKTYVVVKTRIQNIGQSKIRFFPGASTLEVYEYIKTVVTEVITMPDNMLRRFNPLHKDDIYIEPNEIIYGTRFIAIPYAPDLGFRLEFKVISARKRYTWRTSCMVEKFTPNGNMGNAGEFPAEEA
jgi:hypothetical protein